MNPKKVRNLLPEIAIEHKEDLVFLQKLHSFFWDRVRETLSSTTHTRVRILNLGEFERRHWAIQDKINQLNNRLKLAPEHKVKTRENILKELDLLNKMQQFYFGELDRHKQHKIKRDEYNQNLEREGKDSGGD